jgi:hypothetical protein
LPSGLDKICIESTDGLFFWRRRNNDAWVVLVKLVVKPEEVAEAARDREFWGTVGFGGGLTGVA